MPQTVADPIDRRRSARERRFARRAPFVAAVRRAAREVEARDELALSVDLSTSGMRLRRPGGEPLYGLVRVEFEIPDGRGPLVATGWLLSDEHDPGQDLRATGIRFVDLDELDAERIAAFVASRG